MKKFPTREEFVATYFPQLFSLPDSMIYFIMQNPKSSKCYQKMIQACKHFFIRNQILVFHCLQVDDNGWKICLNKECRNEYLTQKINITTEKLVGCKIWIEHTLKFFSTKSSNAASDLIPKVYQCDAENIVMSNQRLLLEQFLFYSKNVKSCTLIKTHLYSETDSGISIETVIANLPNLRYLNYYFHPTSKNVSKDTVKKLLQIPYFKNLKGFYLSQLTQDFDIDSFYSYYKKNKNMDCIIEYKEMPSPEYAELLDGIIDEILDDKYCTAKPLGIWYRGQNINKRNSLVDMRILY